MSEVCAPQWVESELQVSILKIRIWVDSVEKRPNILIDLILEPKRWFFFHASFDKRGSALPLGMLKDVSN